MLFDLWILVATVCAYIFDSNSLHFIVDITVAVVAILRELPNVIDYVRKFFKDT